MALKAAPMPERRQAKAADEPVQVVRLGGQQQSHHAEREAHDRGGPA